MRSMDGISYLSRRRSLDRLGMTLMTHQISTPLSFLNEAKRSEESEREKRVTMLAT